MKTKVMYILLACTILLAASGCTSRHDKSSESATEQGTAATSSASATEATRENNETSSSDETSTAGSSGPTNTQGGENTSGNTISQNQTSSGHAGGRQSSTSSSGSVGTPGGGTLSGGGTTHSTPSSQTPSSTPSSKPESSSPPSKPDSSSSSSSKPNGGESKPAVPDYLKPYVYPFNVSAIKADLIAYGESLGMTHYTHHPDGELRTPDNCSWWDPYPLAADCKDPAQTRRQLREMVEYDKAYFGLVDFTIYIESGPSNQYNIYMMH